MKKAPTRFRHLLPLTVAALMALPLLPACGGKEAPAGDAEGIAVADTARLIVAKANKLARLYTMEYHIHKIVTHADDSRLTGSVLSVPVDVKLPASGRRIAIPIDVTVKAFVDFGQFGVQNVERTDSGIVLTLPDPQVIVSASKIDNKAVRQYVDLARSRYSDAQMTALARQGEDSIISHLDRAEIMRTAQESAARTLLPLLHRIGFDERRATIRFRSDLEPTQIKFEKAG